MDRQIRCMRDETERERKRRIRRGGGRGKGRRMKRRKKGAPGEKKKPSRVWWFGKYLERKLLAAMGHSEKASLKMGTWAGTLRMNRSCLCAEMGTDFPALRGAVGPQGHPSLLWTQVLHL